MFLRAGRRGLRVRFDNQLTVWAREALAAARAPTWVRQVQELMRYYTAAITQDE